MATEDAYQSSPFPVIEIDEVDSTNSEALRRAGLGERGPQWILARRQMAGRGRSGRGWTSHDGNLAATLLLAPRCAPLVLHQLSLLTGVAVHDALLELGGGSGIAEENLLRLKWPNDILAGDAKLGGILIESTTSGADIIAAIGVGLNLAVAPDIEGRETISTARLGFSPAPAAMLAILDAQMRRWLDLWQNGRQFDRIRSAWLERAVPRGVAIAVNTGRESLHGVFAGIDETGALLVDSVRGQSRELRRFTFGDVSLLPLKPEGSS